MDDDDRAYALRLMDFIIDHIDKPYTADECGRVLELRQYPEITEGVN